MRNHTQTSLRGKGFLKERTGGSRSRGPGLAEFLWPWLSPASQWDGQCWDDTKLGLSTRWGWRKAGWRGRREEGLPRTLCPPQTPSSVTRPASPSPAVTQ